MLSRQNSKQIFLHFLGLGIFAALLFGAVSNVIAAPARPVEVNLTQPDGSQFQAVPWGDEWLNGMETREGYTIIKSSQTLFWVYAQLTPEQDLAPSRVRGAELVVGRDDPTGLPKHLRPARPSSEAGLSPFITESRGAPSLGGNLGTRKTLVLLVEFKNYTSRTSVEDWQERIFGETNSVRHYYDQVSFGQVALVPAAETHGTVNDGIVGWITLPYSHPNTGNSLGSANLQIVRDAIIAANEFVDFAAFDQDGNGYLSFNELHIMVIVAGHEGAYGGSQACSPNVWAHQYALDLFSVSAPIVDTIKVASYFGFGGYTQFGEIHCEPANFPGHPATTGIIAHEFGHDLNWPDLYDITGQTAGIGYWGLMGNGMWNYQTSDVFAGDSPAHPTAWSRWYQGWLTPFQVTTSSLAVNLPQVQTSGVVLQLLNNPYGVDWVFKQKSGVGEYFLVENRQQVGYDAGLPGCGLLIWKINEGVRSDNYANADPNRRLVDLVQADGLRHLNTTSSNKGDPGDPFPGSTLNTTFNATSNPNSTLNGQPSGVSLTAISNCSPLMTANVFVNTFIDISPLDWSWASIEALTASGITNGCGNGLYCPDQPASRAQMAIMLLRAKYGPTFAPPAAAGIFNDVQLSFWAGDWIEALYAEGITVGCALDPMRYCPDDSVTRAEMAVFLLRSKYGPAYAPPTAQGIFADVPVGHWAAGWIEQLFQEGITTGCSLEPMQYCPEKTLTRAEIAAFLTRTFNLPQP